MRRLRLREDESGFTLIEMVLVVAMLGIVLGGITTVFLAGSRAELNVNTRFQAQEGARLALAALRRDVHNACTAKVTGTAPALLLTLSIPVTGGTPAVAPIPKEQCGTTNNPNNITKVIWCAVAMTNPSTKYGLYRSTSGTCNATGKLVADNLVTTLPNFAGFFQIVQTGIATIPFGQFQTVDIDIPVSLKQGQAGAPFDLKERLSLRNTVWTTTTATTCSPSVPCIPGPCDQVDVAQVPIPCYPPALN